MAEPKPHSPSLLSMLCITLPLIAVMYVLVVAMNTGDMLWFYPVFDEIPVGITLRCNGETTEIRPGDPAFAAVTSAVNKVISSSKRWDDLSLSDATWEEYQNSDNVVVLILAYDPPARIHSSYKFMKRIDTIVIPLVGRHAQYNTLFGRMGDYIAAGSFHFKTMAPIEEVLQAQGLCPLP